LRNAPTALMKNLGYGESYKYSHDFPENFVDQEFLPEEISGTSFYDPGGNPREAQMRETLRHRWKEKIRFLGELDVFDHEFNAASSSKTVFLNRV
jgi:putative ATPase